MATRLNVSNDVSNDSPESDEQLPLAATWGRGEDIIGGIFASAEIWGGVNIWEMEILSQL